MKRLIVIFLLLLLSVWLGLKIAADPGYMLLAYKEWTIEMPLWAGAASVVILFTLLYMVIRSLKFTGSLFGRWQNWRVRRKNRNSRCITSKGLLELVEGDWAAAEKYLVKSVNRSDMPLINYLAAAQAAQEQGAEQRQQRYLRKAQREHPEAEFAVGLTQAQLQLRNGQYEQALASLKHLHSIEPKHEFVIMLLRKVYQRVHDWDSLQQLLPKLRKVLNTVDYEQMELETYQGLLANAGKAGSGQELETLWDDLPKSARKLPALVKQYAEALIHAEKLESAESVLRDNIKKHWDEELIALYGQTRGKDIGKQLSIVEHWLKQHANNPQLLLACARIARCQELWGKARSYLEQSVELLPSAEAYTELATLLEQLEEPEAAAKCYRQGALLY